MALKKTRFKPPVYDANGVASYPDTVHFETSADLVKYNDTQNMTEAFEAHKGEIMPHRMTNLKTGKTYRYGYQISADGIPQVISEEVV